MLFNTPQYLIFLSIVVPVYYCLPKKIRYIWLLGVSYYFYMQWNPLYITLLFSCTLLTYISALIIEKLNSTVKKRACFIVCITLNLCILGYFKYFNFGVDCINGLLRFIHLNETGWNHDILLPVGISFYTLQALGYLIDVYRGDIYAEKNFLRYALFVSFFPQLVAGPIERSKNLLVQLKEAHPFEYENLRKGALLILYGLFLKMVIADRAAMIVDTVYNDSANYLGLYIPIATCFFAIQIYCDFYGYSTIARGSACIMGIKLTDNFAAPYYSQSVKEFWRRWHISLSGWFRDYLYIPLGGNRKGSVRKQWNLLAVFTVSGLWHGSSFAFVFWGLLNGIYQVIGDFFRNLSRKILKHRTDAAVSETGNADCFSKQLFRTIFTFGLITFAWMFFRAGDLQTAKAVFKNMLHVKNWTLIFNGSLYMLGVTRQYMNVLLASIVVLFVVDYHKYRERDVAGWLLGQGWWFRVTVYMLLIYTIMLYGCYGEIYDIQQFIYFQF